MDQGAEHEVPRERWSHRFFAGLDSRADTDLIPAQNDTEVPAQDDTPPGGSVYTEAVDDPGVLRQAFHRGIPATEG